MERNRLLPTLYPTEAGENRFLPEVAGHFDHFCPPFDEFRPRKKLAIKRNPGPF